MNRDISQFQWNEASMKAKAQARRPTSDRLEMIAAKRDQLESEIQLAHSILNADADMQFAPRSVERENG